MIRRIAALFTVASTLFAIGCGCGGVTGTQGQLVFGSPIHFQDADALTGSVAAGSTVVLSVEADHNATTGANTAALSGVSLSVSSIGHTGEATVAHLASNQWSVRLAGPGEYTVYASNASGYRMDSITLHAVAADTLRVGTQARVTTFVPGTHRTCHASVTVDLATLVLHPNQEAELVTVPVDAAGEPVAGMLTLSGTGTHGATLSPRAAGAYTQANVLALNAPDAGDEGVDVALHDAVTRHDVHAQVATSAENAAVDCQ